MDNGGNHNVGNKAVEKGAKALATAYFGPAGGKAVDVLSKAKDIKAINDRVKNQSNHSNNYGGTKKADTESTDGLGPKEGLEEKDNTTNNKDNKKNKNSSLISDGIDLIVDKNSLKAKLFKLKIKLTIAGIVAGFLLILFVISYISTAFDAVTNSIAAFFGVSEDNTSESLFKDEKYHINPETNEYYTTDELVMYLKEDEACPTTFWTKIGDALTPGFGGNYCKFIRYVKNTTEELEKKYPSVNLDKSLILATMFYGYGTQPSYSQYIDSKNVPTKVSGTEHLESLVDMLKNGTLTRQDIDDIIHNSMISIYQADKNWDSFDKNHGFKDSNYKNDSFIFYSTQELKYNSYSWQIDIEEKRGKTIGTGRCVKKEQSYSRYDLNRWEMFVRFGEEAAHYYDLFLGRNNAYYQSDTECNGSKSKSELLDLVASTGVDEAKIKEKEIDESFEYLKRGPITNLELFKQKASTKGYTKDVIIPFTSSIGETVELDYRNGFAYKRFPYFERAINGEGGQTTLKYDDAITPKIIESIIVDIKEKKSVMNDILLLDDYDNLYGLGNFGNIWSSVKGAYCSEYVNAPFNEIMVELRDCDSVKFGTTNFKDYIMGVAYGEVSNKNDDYVKAQMVAAISYSLHRRGNYRSVPNIVMRSGTCDQVYCSMASGCSYRPSGIGLPSYLPGLNYTFYHGAAGAALAEKYSRLYDEASQFLLVKDGVPFNAHYVSTIQNSWYNMAQSGMSFTQIMQATYANEGAELVRCEDLDNTSSTPSNKIDKSPSITNNDKLIPVNR